MLCRTENALTLPSTRTTQSSFTVSRSRFEPDNFRIRCRHVNHLTASVVLCVTGLDNVTFTQFRFWKESCSTRGWWNVGKTRGRNRGSKKLYCWCREPVDICAIILFARSTARSGVSKQRSPSFAAWWVGLHGIYIDWSGKDTSWNKRCVLNWTAEFRTVCIAGLHPRSPCHFHFTL